MLRVLLFISILTLIFISIGGYIGVSLNWLPDNLSKIYNEHFSFITGLASVIGLLAFASTRKIKSTDFQSEELEKLNSLMKATDELKSIQENKHQTRKELEELEIKKAQMGISIKKASAALFNKDQKDRNEKIVLDIINSNEDLKASIQEINKAIANLEILEEEITKDENVEIIRQILQEQDNNQINDIYTGSLLNEVINIVATILPFRIRI